MTAGLGTTLEDVQAVQQTVMREYVSVAESVRAIMPQLDTSSAAAWDVLAARVLAFTAPLHLGVDVAYLGLPALYDEGQSIRYELETTWPNKIASLGGPAPVPLKQVPAPPPPGSGKSLWQALNLDAAMPLLALFLIWDVTRKK